MSFARRKRSDAIDVARAFALLAMAVYHLIWDLAAFDFLPPGAPFTPDMRLASNLIAATFLALVGVSLTLAHRDGLRAGAFFRRLAIIGSAAALTTLATFAVEPRAPVFFGILHCIVISSALAALLLRMPPWAACLVGGMALLAPSVLRTRLLDSPIVLWIGLGFHEPLTVDWRPLLPWGGVIWFTLGLTRLVTKSFWDSRFMRWRARDHFTRAAAWLGRHSLAFYLAHQPILFGLVFMASTLLGVAAAQEREAFLATCTPTCVESGGTIEACARSCACVADRSIRTNVLTRLGARFRSEQENVNSMAVACAADAR